MKRYLLFFLMFLVTQCLCAQHTLAKKWDKRFGGINNDIVEVMQKCKDGGYIMGGYSVSNQSGDKTQNNWDTTLNTDDFWIVKIDSAGNKIWDKRFGGRAEDLITSITEVSDGSYLLGGATSSNISGDKTQASRGGYDFWVVKIDSLGNKLWDKCYGGNRDEILHSQKATSDKGFILAGRSNSGISGDKTEGNRDSTSFTDDYWMVKIDSLGNKQWDKRFGGSGEEGSSDVLQTSDGGYLIGGTSYSGISGDKTQADYGSANYWIIKTDSLGSKLWDRVYGGTGGEELHTMLVANDGNYMLGGNTYSGLNGDKSQSKTGYWVLKIDTIGNKIWDRTYGINTIGNSSADFYFASLASTSDHGFILTGQSGMPAGDDKSEDGLGREQAWIVRIDSIGNKLWDKTIFSTGGSDNGVSIVQSVDECYVLAIETDAGIGGYKSQPNWEPHDSLFDYWIVKLCDTSLTGITETAGSIHFSVFPNPTINEVSIMLQKDDLKEAAFTLTNTSGQLIYQSDETNLASTYTKMLDLGTLPAGIYLLEIVVDGERIVRKVVKE